MIAFIVENLGTILVGLLVAAAAAASVRKIIRDRRKGSCGGCGCGCGACGQDQSGCGSAKETL